MSGKTIFDGTSPKTQSVEAEKALLTWKGRAVDPLPSVVAFANEGEESRLMLVLSGDKKNYYVTTERACSCAVSTDRPGAPCKHQRKYFGARPEQAKEASESIRPTGEWVGPDGQRANGPVEA